MQYMTTILSMLFALLGFALADEVKFFLNNNCGFNVYVREAVGQFPGNGGTKQCANFGESQEGKLSAGGGALGVFPVYQDSCGHSVKVARYPGGPVYQWEYTWADDNGKMWYDLSHEDGNPFTDVEREMAPQNGCPNLRCDAGNEGSQCDYPSQTDCASLGAIQGFLCGRGAPMSWEDRIKKAVAIPNLPPA